ncbi:MAG: helix-turn-helix domain-containing protein [Xanthobacteraceae bacterium]
MTEGSAPESLLRFSTDAYDAGERAAAWQEIFARTVVGINITPLSRDGFRAEASLARLAELGVIYASTSAVHQANARELIVNDDVSVMAGPTCRWRAFQLGREADNQPGDGALMSNDDLGSITLADLCSYTTFSLPRARLERLVPDLGALFARRIPATNPAFRMLLRYLEIAGHGDLLTTPELKKAFTDHVVDLLALALGATREAAELARSRGVRAARLHAFKEDIRKGLRGPELSVRAIAKRHNVSPRYVQKLFEESGSTFTQFVLEQRLAAAHAVLSSAACLRHSITAVAYDCGFNDLSAFDRAFRRRFGCTPTDVRAAARRNGGGDREMDEGM